MANKKISRRSFLKRLTYSVLGLFGISGGTYYYSKHIEPFSLSIKKETIFSPKLPSSFENLKIVQFGDTHLGFHYELSQFERLTREINQLEPDIVLFTGDLVDNPNQYPEHKLIDCTKYLSKINSTIGKYWIYGNHDHGGYGTHIIRSTMENAGFQTLQNEYTSIEKDGKIINLAGLDDVMLGRPDLHTTIDGANLDHFTILMCHEPDFADQSTQFPIDVQFSGHSHGGQIQIPLIGYVITPPLAEKYVEGKYILGDHPLQLFVTRGIGTTRLPYRFLCKPEINVYTLKNGEVG